MLLSLLLTAGVFGLLLLIGTVRETPEAPSETLVVLAAQQIAREEEPPPEEPNIDQPEVFADSPDEAAPQSRPRTIAPAPALPVIPPAAIDLAQIELPQIPVTGEGPIITPGAASLGDLARGPQGPGGAGGDGLSGNGSGGAGNGTGTGTRLIAAWAPSMDFSHNHRFYPPAARKKRIEGVAYLDCFVLRNERVRTCRLLHESPSGYGFGKAALKSRPWMRIRVYTQTGRRVHDKWVVVRSYFELEPEQGDETTGTEPEDAQAAGAEPEDAQAVPAP